MNYNKLTPSELEALALLAEECGEVIQAIGKIMRHGLDEHWKNGPTNREQLTKEVGDLTVAIGLVSSLKMISMDSVAVAIVDKSQKINQFLHYNKV